MGVCLEYGWIATNRTLWDPLYLNINGPIWLFETAQEIEVELIKIKL
jgi:predicted double-glycine peptidase